MDTNDKIRKLESKNQALYDTIKSQRVYIDGIIQDKDTPHKVALALSFISNELLYALNENDKL